LRATSGNSEPVGRIELQYVCERENRPVEYGTLEFDAVGLKWLRSHGDVRVQKMAECYMRVHLEKRHARVTQDA
jgi:hypothetical protein